MSPNLSQNLTERYRSLKILVPILTECWCWSWFWFNGVGPGANLDSGSGTICSVNTSSQAWSKF